jgi:hypothetical protein
MPLRRAPQANGLFPQRRYPQLKEFPHEKMARHVDAQVVELTWLIGHFCLLNRWFTALRVPDEGPKDEDNFEAAYQAVVPRKFESAMKRLLPAAFSYAMTWAFSVLLTA